MNANPSSTIEQVMPLLNETATPSPPRGALETLLRFSSTHGCIPALHADDLALGKILLVFTKILQSSIGVLVL